MQALQYSSHMTLFHTRQKENLGKTVMESVKSDENDFCEMVFFMCHSLGFWQLHLLDLPKIM